VGYSSQEEQGCETLGDKGGVTAVGDWSVAVMSQMVVVRHKMS